MQKIILFQDQKVRREWLDEEWWFSVIDVISVLTDSATPRKYLNTLKTRQAQLSSLCRQLKMPAADGKNYRTDIANTEGSLVKVKLKHFPLNLVKH